MKNMSNYVRVSEILARFQPYQDVDPVVLEEKAKIGTNVHQAIVADCAGDFVCLSSDRAEAYFQSYKMWKENMISTWKKYECLKEKQINITQIPRLYCDKLMLTGECDGIFNDAQLIDWKCSASAHEKIWNMQAHFYWYLLRENGYSIADTMFWINLGHDKHTFRDSKTNAIKRVTYTPKEPTVHTFKFSEKVLRECLDEAIKYWEEKQSALVLD